MKMYLATVVLCISITLITFGIHTNNLIFISIGAMLAGVYNAMIYKDN